MIQITTNTKQAQHENTCSAYLSAQQVSETSKIGKTQCNCNKMTSNLRTYAGGFKVPTVNTINFSKVFSNFGSLLTSNPATFATVLCLLALWVLLSVWARRADRKDVEKVRGKKTIVVFKRNMPKVTVLGWWSDFRTTCI